MRQLRRIASFWPGFTELWDHGSPIALVAALFFSLLSNTAFLSTFVWPDLMSGGTELVLWSATGLCFVVAATYSFISARVTSKWQSCAQDLFLRAQREYLSGEWTAAETLIAQIVKRQPADVEAQLFLATIYRHAGRLADAREQLRQMSRWSRSSEWAMEIQNEWNRTCRIDDSKQDIQPRTSRAA